MNSESIVGAWVKIPGLDPNESGALHYLNIGELEKLAARVNRAIERANRKADALSSVRPGQSAYLKRRYATIPADAVGFVADRSMIVNNETQPDDYVPVCFCDYGIGWVPVSYLRLKQ